MNKNRYAYGYEIPLNVPTQSVPVIIDTLNGKQYHSLKQVVELLNGYEMLCLMLININSELHDSITELKEENEQLQKDKAQLKERLRECRIKMDKFNCR